jgi:DNA transposition AAA+ family ATPase
MASKPQERPEEQGLDSEAVRLELVKYKTEHRQSWSDLANRIGVPSGTLSSFGSGSYSGDNLKIARTVAKFFRAEAEEAALRVRLVMEPPAYQQTRAGLEVTHLLRWARRGKIAVVATSPGYGKTSALRQFASETPQVWVATMAPSTAGVATMLAEILDAMGERDARGSPQMLSRRIRDKVRGTGGLIALDDAQHLSEKALEELRGLHDVTGVGVALLGNAGLLQRLEGGTRTVAFAQLFSRISLRVVKTLAYPEDGVRLGRAWGIEDERMLAWLGEMTVKPGGLRSISMTIELAAVLASADGAALSMDHLRDAWAQLSHRPHAN